MYKSIFLTFFLLILTTNTLFSEKIIDMVLARIDSDVITYSEVMERAALMNIKNNAPIDTPVSIKLKEKVLDMLIMEKILVKEAHRQELYVKKEKLLSEIKDYRSKEDFNIFTETYDISADEFNLMVKKMLLSDKMSANYAKKRFSEKKADEETIRKAILDWYESLKKRHRIITYSIP